jgi:hypothetical protein
MKHDQAREYLTKMFTHKGNGNIFTSFFAGKPLIFPGMYGAAPTDKQRLALAQAITSDKSKEGTDFMYKLIKKIISQRKGRLSAVHTLSPRLMASMYRTQAPGRRKIR